MTSPRSTPVAPASCDYCGLPIGGALWSRLVRAKECASESPSSQPSYCCSGCRLAAQITGERGERGAMQGMLLRVGLSVFLSINVMMFTMALWSRDFYSVDAGAASRLASSLDDLFRYLSLLLSLPVLWMLGAPIGEHAWERRLRGLPSTDALVLLGVVAAFAYSAVSVFRGSGHIYFEVGCAVLVMVTLGRWLEATGKLQATASLDALEQMLPREVRRSDERGEISVAIAEVEVGDCLRVLAGERVPVDGRVRHGSALVDWQLLTGESVPRSCEPGSLVTAGCLNLDGDLLIEATAPANAGALARLVELVREARRAKGHYQRLTERVADVFLPSVVAIAVVTCAWHFWHSGVEQAVMSSLAVLLIACPCALGLATPMAVSAALGTAAREQVLFRNGEAIERLASIRAIRFDKTGTLTTSQPRVEQVLLATPARKTELLAAARMLANASNHVYAQAIDRHCRSAGLSASVGQLAGVRVCSGRGIRAELGTNEVYLGSKRWMCELGMHCSRPLIVGIEAAESQGQGVSLVASNGEVQAAFVLHEQLRPTAVQAVTDCAQLGLDVAILTGDHRRRGAALEQTLGQPVVAELLPEGKLQAIRAAQARWGPTAMVGDGVNDAPALAAADLGIALGCGADVSRDSAQVCLLGDDPSRVPWAIDLARRTVRVIRWNLAWAFGYNAVGVGLAAAGWLNPAWAALAMVASSAFVVGNCLRLHAAGAQSPAGHKPAPHTNSVVAGSAKSALAPVATVR